MTSMFYPPNGQTYEFDEEYSLKDMTGIDLTGRKGMKDIVIQGSCFSRETPNSEVFPKDMTGVTFIDCNLDNCSVPDGNTVLGGSQRRIKVQNDLEDWIVDENGEPVEPVNKKHFENLGLSTDPKDLPDEIQDISVTSAKIEEIELVKTEAVKNILADFPY